jgi:hypothetical protein
METGGINFWLARHLSHYSFKRKKTAYLLAVFLG